MSQTKAGANEMTSADVYANTNPALCSLILRMFADGYAQLDPTGSELALSFLPIPVVLSMSLSETLNGTNRKTGLIRWIGANQQIRLGLSEQINQTTELARRGILFGSRYELISISDAQRLLPGSAKISATQYGLQSPRVRDSLSKAKRLGAWCGEIRSAATILHALGVRV